ncbi:MAG TPA: putative ABC transporter permease [Candidatus Blautia merdavium]|uniref:ABC transporter permease n=1 Tax=Candidatus Blautia merdavium TaxID=2838494 RepID=A0A9D2TBA2_9FIRM|nr:putative ABC transporter permease [Candidatus Blautia merdavium]
MTYTLEDFMWIFYIYSFAGWCAGVAANAMRRKRFINTGFLNLPLCPVYGTIGIVFSIFLPELEDHWFFLALGGSVLAAVVIVVTGVILEHVFGRKWWDYSKTRFQFQGYLNYQHLLGFAVGAVLCTKVLNPLLLDLEHRIPEAAEDVLLLLLGLLFLADTVCCGAAVLSLHRTVRMMRFTGRVQEFTDDFGNALTRHVQRRMERSYPNLEIRKILDTPAREKDREVFARGCCFYKLAGLFFIGSFLGDLVETIFCYVRSGVLMSRSSVVYGPFSIVWGFGCALLTAFLYKYREKSDRYIFVYGTVLGGAYEYICSALSELVFGTVFWDYSEIPFNLGGRINLLYCFFWGIAAVVWLKILYPILSSWIEKLPVRTGTVLTWVMVVFMTVNMAISALALYRYDTRREQPEAQNGLERFLDTHFDDARMEKIYPNAKEV